MLNTSADFSIHVVKPLLRLGRKFNAQKETRHRQPCPLEIISGSNVRVECCVEWDHVEREVVSSDTSSPNCPNDSRGEMQ